MRKMPSPGAIEPRPHLQEPSAWVCRWAAALGDGERVLDFAGGAGRNLPPLLERGARVTVVDRDPEALAQLPAGVERLCAELETGAWPLRGRRFDAVVCCNYLFRPRLDLLAALVARGGLLVYETFAQGNERFGRPSRPDFLLRRGELLQVAMRAGLEVIAYEDGRVSAPRPAMMQRVCALRPPAASPLTMLPPITCSLG